MTDDHVVIAVKRTIRQFRQGHKPISNLAMRELEKVLLNLCSRKNNKKTKGRD